MQDAKEEVRARLNIEDVVGEYVQLKRAGRNFKGLSPFTAEKTPSFTVSPDKHIWHDFSSGKGGDVFSFIMEVEGLDFRAALEQLARKAGVDLTQFDSKKSGDIAKKRKRLIEANELTANYFQAAMLQNSHALSYIFEIRKLSKQIVQSFRIGYAPSSGSVLVTFLEKKGFSKKEITDSGLTNRYGGDIFRGRMSVPLMDASGQVIGFTGRILEDVENAPKYLNTPGTLIYDKSRHVFGLSQAKESIRTRDEVVIVEGNMDVISSHQVGVTHVVATAGTAMTEGHLKVLSRLTQNIKLAFDGDKAGLAATERAIPIAQAVGVELMIVRLPDGVKDPDDLIQQSTAQWQKAIEEAVPAVDWVIGQYQSREDLETAAGKRQFTTAALKVLQVVKDSVERDHYIQKIAHITSTSPRAVREKYLTLADEGMGSLELKTPRIAQEKHRASPSDQYQENALAVLLLAPSTRHLLEGFDTSLFSTEEARKLANYLKTHSDSSADTILALKEIETYVKIVELKAETRYVDWQSSDLELEAARLLRHMTTQKRKQTTETLLDALRSAEANGDDVEAAKLRSQLHELIKENARG